MDSVMSCLNYKGFLRRQHHAITVNGRRSFRDQQHGEWDTLRTLRTINYARRTSLPVPGRPAYTGIPNLSKTMLIRKGKDSVQNQIRIRLSNSFAQELITRDTTLIGNGNFKTDSLFRSFMNGFAVSANSGNALMYFNLNDFQTRLEVHYRRKNGGAPDCFCLFLLQ
ncbi:MAG: DUF4270 family protein [Ferruginibacter sp.]